MKENDFTLMLEEVQNQLLDLLNEEVTDLEVVKLVMEMFMMTAKGVADQLQELRWNSQLPSETFQENVIHLAGLNNLAVLVREKLRKEGHDF